jgi:hypothetical protein
MRRLDAYTHKTAKKTRGVPERMSGWDKFRMEIGNQMTGRWGYWDYVRFVIEGRISSELDCDRGSVLGHRVHLLESGELNLNESFAGKMGFIA